MSTTSLATFVTSGKKVRENKEATSHYIGKTVKTEVIPQLITLFGLDPATSYSALGEYMFVKAIQAREAEIAKK